MRGGKEDEEEKGRERGRERDERVRGGGTNKEGEAVMNGGVWW